MNARCLVIALIFNSACIQAACIPTSGDGEKGVESCGIVQVSLSMPALARVNQLEPFSLGTFDYQTSPQASENFCIWYNTSQFVMTVSSANSAANNSFNLLGNSTSELIPYQLLWYKQSSNSGESLDLSNRSDDPISRLSLPQLFDSDCTTDNVSFNVLVPLENLQNKPQDEYSDTLTVTVSVQ